MKRIGKMLLACLAMAVFWLPESAMNQVPGQNIIYVVCWKYVSEKNCNKCSKSFSVLSEDEAVRRCKRMGYAEPNYFRSQAAIARWIRPNCTCDDEDR
jgi:hypothetical protein